MPILASFRVSLAYKLSPLFVVVQFLNLQQPAYDNSPYPLARTAGATAIIFVVAPLAAMCAAWDGARLRRSDWLRQPRTRPLASIAFWALVPTVVVSCSAFLVGIAVGVWPSLPVWSVVLEQLAILLAWIVLGLGIGLNLPAVVSLPAVLIGGYVWFAVPIAMQPLWLRHVSGALFSCCDISDDLAIGAQLGALSFAAGVAVCAGVLVRAAASLRPSLWRAISPVPVAVGLALAIPFVNSLGPDPAVARQYQASCAGASPAVCGYPEHAEVLSDIAKVAGEAYPRWSKHGIELPPELREGQPTAPGRAGVINAFGLPDRDGMAIRVIRAALPAKLIQCTHGNRDARSRRSALAAWMALSADVPPQRVRAGFGPQAARSAAQARDERSHLDRWIRRQVRVLESCDLVEPPA